MIPQIKLLLQLPGKRMLQSLQKTDEYAHIYMFEACGIKHRNDERVTTPYPPFLRGITCVIHVLLFLLLFLDLGPGVTQCGGTVEYQLFVGRIRINTEITDAFELDAAQRCGAFQCWFHVAGGQYLQ